MQHLTWAEIDLANLRHNLREIRRRVLPHAKLLACVKANGYGHGAVEVAQVLEESGADMFGVATLAEACELQDGGIARPILILGVQPPPLVVEALRRRIIPTICDRRSVREIAKHFSASDGQPAEVHVKVDTGMGRIGLRATEALDFIKEVRALRHVHVTGIFTHFAMGDDEECSFTKEQLLQFKQLLNLLEGAGIDIPIRHASNSITLLNFPECHFNMVRVGLSLYGLYGAESARRKARLRPVLSLKTRIAFIKHVPRGTGLSYGQTFTTKRESIIGTLPIGYADGLNRALSNQGEVLVRGVRAPIVGRVCMDQCLIDVTDIPGASVGDEVVVYGQQGGECISVEEVAAKLNTIPYEVVCWIGRRVPRIHVEHSRPHVRRKKNTAPLHGRVER